jgi:hypothetical protein
MVGVILDVEMLGKWMSMRTCAEKRRIRVFEHLSVLV